MTWLFKATFCYAAICNRYCTIQLVNTLLSFYGLQIAQPGWSKVLGLDMFYSTWNYLNYLNWFCMNFYFVNQQDHPSCQIVTYCHDILNCCPWSWFFRAIVPEESLTLSKVLKQAFLWQVWQKQSNDSQGIHCVHNDTHILHVFSIAWLTVYQSTTEASVQFDCLTGFFPLILTPVGPYSPVFPQIPPIR